MVAMRGDGIAALLIGAVAVAGGCPEKGGGGDGAAGAAGWPGGNFGGAGIGGLGMGCGGTGGGGVARDGGGSSLDTAMGGGAGAGAGGGGAAFNELTVDRWTPMTGENEPTPRTHATAVWTGREMIVWGGKAGGLGVAELLGSGGRYDPVADRWVALPSLGAPSPRTYHTAVWTGREMIVWGGWDATRALGDGARYDPATDRWSPVTPTRVAHLSHTTVWTGREMVVWGGVQARGPGAGFRYDPGGDRWTGMNTQRSPVPVNGQTATLAGAAGIIYFGGIWPLGVVGVAGLYDPSQDVWRGISSAGAPARRFDHSAVFTGRRLIVWGGVVNGGVGGRTGDGSGGLYDPELDSWRPTSVDQSPSGGSGQLVVWAEGAGSRGTGLMLVVSLRDDISRCWDARAYDPASDRWMPLSMTGSPGRRGYGVAVWTGTQMLLWGGADADGPPVAGGARYEP